MENQNRLEELIALAVELKNDENEELEATLHTFREVLMRQYARSNKACYHINKAIEIFNQNTKNGKDWKTKSRHRNDRRPLTELERDYLLDLAGRLRAFEVHPQLQYYINNL